MPRKQGGRRKGGGGGGGRRKGKGNKPQSGQNGPAMDRVEQEQMKENLKKQNEETKERETYIGLDIGCSFIKVAVVTPIAMCEKSNENGNNLNENSGSASILQIPESIEDLSNILCNDELYNQYFHKRINILADNMGHHSIPCVITYLQDNNNKGEILIGSEAVKSSLKHYKNCIYHLKQLLSIHYSDYTENDNDNDNDNENEANETKEDNIVNNNNNVDLSFDIESMQSKFQHWKKQCSEYGMDGAIVRPNFDFEEWSDIDDYDDDNDNEQEIEKQKKLNVIKQNRPKKQQIVRLTYRLPQNNDNNDEFDISQAMIDILTKVYQFVSSQTMSEKIHCVMSVPSYYNEYQRKYLQTLVYRVGFNPIQTLPDYASAIIASGIDKMENDSKTDEKNYVLVIDFGTWQTIVTICEIVNGMINVVYCTSSENEESKQVSGNAMDNCIMKFCIKNFESTNRGMCIEPENRKSRLKLLREITRIKHTLSSGANQVMFDIESFYEGMDYHFQLSKAKFEMIIYDILKQIPQFIENEISKADFKISSFSNVIAMGGSAQIPKLREKLSEMFGDKLLNDNFNQRGILSNFINVYGCAIQATTLSYLDLFEKKLNKLMNEGKLNNDNNVMNGCENVVAFERPLLNKKNEKNIFMTLNQFQNNMKMEEKELIGQKQDKLDESKYFYNCVENEIMGFKNKNDFLNENVDLCFLDSNIRLEYSINNTDNDNKRHLLCQIGKNTMLPYIEKIDMSKLNLPMTNNLDLNIYCCEMDDDNKAIVQESNNNLIWSNEKKKKSKSQKEMLIISVDENEIELMVDAQNRVSFALDTNDNDNDNDDEDDNNDDNDVKTNNAMIDVD